VHSINPTSRIAAVALIECPECQKSVSDKAAACPHIDSGTAVLLEPNAAYQNTFNGLEHATARCLYDLKNDVASIELIRP
jgi:hypothetical protein